MSILKKVGIGIGAVFLIFIILGVIGATLNPTGKATETQLKESITTTTIYTPTTIIPSTTSSTSQPQKQCSDFGYYDYCYSGYTCQTVKPNTVLSCCQCIPIQVTTSTTTTTTSTTASSRNIVISYNSALLDHIDYTISGYPYGYTYSIQPDNGKTFLEINATIQNNGYDKFSTNPFYFAVNASNIEYSYDSSTYTLGQWDTVDVLNGGTYTGTLLFQIPLSASSSPFVLSYDQSFVYYNINWIKG